MDLDDLSKRFTGEYNNSKLDDFSGFTPGEMHRIIYAPFSPICPVKTRMEIDPEEARSCPVFNVALSLLRHIEASGRIKLTARGNLPLNLIRDIYREGFFPEKLIEEGFVKIRSEQDWVFLHTIRVVLKVAGLVRKQYGFLLLTKKGLKYVTEGYESNLFLYLLEVYTMNFNWAYNDRFPIEDIGQIGFLYLLFLIKKFGSEFRDVAYYSDLYFRAFPMFRQSLSEFKEPYGDYPENALKIRFFERFAWWFGLIEYDGADVLFFSHKKSKVRKSRLLDALLV